MKDQINETRLANGLTIITDRMPNVRSATLGFFFKRGSRHEPTELNGISHFIEHAVFKGTRRRGTLDIAIEQDRLGGNLDAFTTHEETGFAIKVVDDRVAKAFDLIADMLTEPRFDEKDLKSEQKVIIEEMKMVEDSPEEFLGDIFNEAFFPGHPLGLGIAGTPKTVKSFDSAKTRAYHSETYHAGNLVIAAAGNIDHAAIVELARERFGHDAPSSSSIQTSAPEPSAPIILRQNRNLEQAHLIIATPFTSAPDPKRYAADMLTNILGGGTSSRLWQRIREERGLAYSVGASAGMYQDCGIFSIFAGTSPEHVAEVIELSIAELRNVIRDGVTTDELDLAKQQARASILLGLEDSASRAAALAQSEMVHGRQISVEETLDNLDAVTGDDVQALAREFFHTERIAFAALGKLDGLTVTRDTLTL